MRFTVQNLRCITGQGTTEVEAPSARIACQIAETARRVASGEPPLPPRAKARPYMGGCAIGDSAVF